MPGWLSLSLSLFPPFSQTSNLFVFYDLDCGFCFPHICRYSVYGALIWKASNLFFFQHFCIQFRWLLCVTSHMSSLLFVFRVLQPEEYINKSKFTIDCIHILLVFVHRIYTRTAVHRQKPTHFFRKQLQLFRKRPRQQTRGQIQSFAEKPNAAIQLPLRFRFFWTHLFVTSSPPPSLAVRCRCREIECFFSILFLVRLNTIKKQQLFVWEHNQIVQWRTAHTNTFCKWNTYGEVKPVSPAKTLRMDEYRGSRASYAVRHTYFFFGFIWTKCATHVLELWLSADEQKCKRKSSDWHFN